MIDDEGPWCYTCDAPATNDCITAMIAEELVEFEQFDIIPSTNRDYKLEEVLPNLSCSYCPPNKHENANKGKSYYKVCERKPKQRVAKNNLKQSREFKKLQNKD